MLIGVFIDKQKCLKLFQLIFITQTGYGDMVITSIETLIYVYSKGDASYFNIPDEYLLVNNKIKNLLQI